ncbi:MAG: PLP-dependent lyase/thiolase [Candidatus Berkelbacteria bacterium]|nr:MAG: PLP-dependent lyase/thiolase [Candidatus Berkelbacteria bacterium]QQG51923.1 MAG: PLP-dependent lyase/thiolase [Candidatus Berkelbacteria bacterium]
MPLTVLEERILDSIIVASDNDPAKPEFPADDPKFPATPTYKIEIPGFSNVWLKDESHNPTGTHKDRMAWEIIVTYRDFLVAKESGQVSGGLPTLSIISSGGAAVSIQTQLRKYKLPNLKVLADKTTSKTILAFLHHLGCELYLTDLSRRPFSTREILKLTNNPSGFDITSSEALDPTTRFYDWLSYEVLNNSPEYCFIPFGTGNLYENILNINKREATADTHDPRFKGDVRILRQCNFFGATSNNRNTKADKLYSPHLPFVHYDEQWIRFYRQAGYCGPDSDVFPVEEKYFDEAMQLADANNVRCEYSGIAGLALMLQMKDSLPRDKKMLIVNTGKSVSS